MLFESNNEEGGDDGLYNGHVSMTMKRGHGADSKTSDWKQRYCAIRDVTLVWLSWSRRLVVTCLIIGLIMRAQIIFLTQTRRMISCSLFLDASTLS